MKINKRLLIILSSLVVGVTTISVSAANFFIPSYNAWKETYDAVMEERENRNFEIIEGVTVKTVNLELINYRPSYVISGAYDENVDAEKLTFKLYTKDDRYNLAEVVTKELNTTEKTFRMYTDVSLASADGAGNVNYTIDETTSSPLGDSPEYHCYFPKLVINDNEYDLVNSHLIWNDIQLEHNECLYKIDQTKNGQPRLYKYTDQVIPEDASYTAHGVELAQYENDVCLVIHGTSQGYNRETLSKVFSFELRGTVSSKAVWAIRGTQGGPVIMEEGIENGAWKVFVRLNDIPLTGTGAPYYSRIGDLIVDGKGRTTMGDFIADGVNGTKDLDQIYFGDKLYTIYIKHGTSANDAYGTVGISVKNA